MLQFLGLVLCGALLAEGAGYWWHRFASHVGVFRHFHYDLLRRRHFDHHIHRYPKKRLSSKSYLESCEISFQFLAVIIIVIIAVLVTTKFLSILTAAVILGSGIAYGVLILGKLHSHYHLENGPLEKFAVFRWLRDFHHVHHLVNANYTILLPIFDILGRSYVSPKRLPDLKAENQFPRFDASLSSSCGESLFYQ